MAFDLEYLSRINLYALIILAVVSIAQYVSKHTWL